MGYFFTFLLMVIMIVTGGAQTVFLNEIRANDDGTDDAEFIELIGPAGFDISGWEIAHVNGNDGNLIFSFAFPAGTIFPDDGITDLSGQGIGLIVVKRTGHTVLNSDFEWGSTAMQNGPDGIILSDDRGTRIQALTWNGTGSLNGGEPAWRNIGNDNNDDNSLCAPDSLKEAYKKLWMYTLPTPGTLNTNQTSGDISLPVQLTSFRAMAGDGEVRLLWTTESELHNLGFIIERAYSADGEYTQIATYESVPALAGAGSSSSGKTYQFTDTAVFNGTAYWYRLIDVSIQGVRTIHLPVSATPVSSSQEENPTGMNETQILPGRFHLDQNYPNPFNPWTKIKFSIAGEPGLVSAVNLTVFDLNGNLIRVLVNDKLPAGFFEITWDGKNKRNLPVAAGTYFYVLTTDTKKLAKKMHILK